MSKQFWGVLGVIALIFVGILFFNGKSDKNASSNTPPSNHVFGDTSSSVKLLEYGDYQCPACGAFYPVVKQVATKYKDQVAFQFRNLPLTSLHPNAFAAARAAESAGLQGKYFEMHDLLYENQSAWAASSDPMGYFKTFATQIGLNMDTFNKDYPSTAVNNTINADINAFDKTGAEKATPTFFLNGKQIKSADLLTANGQPSVEKFSALIDAALAANKQPANQP